MECDSSICSLSCLQSSGLLLCSNYSTKREGGEEREKGGRERGVREEEEEWEVEGGK